MVEKRKGKQLATPTTKKSTQSTQNAKAATSGMYLTIHFQATDLEIPCLLVSTQLWRSLMLHVSQTIHTMWSWHYLHCFFTDGKSGSGWPIWSTHGQGGVVAQLKQISKQIEWPMKGDHPAAKVPTTMWENKMAPPPTKKSWWGQVVREAFNVYQ